MGLLRSMAARTRRGRPANAKWFRVASTDTGRRQGAAVKEPHAQEPYSLDSARRQVVLNSLKEVCHHRGWTLLAAHVRTNHIHIVITGNCKPEGILIAMKAYSSLALNKHELDDIDRRRWARHGSTSYLWTRDTAQAAIHYVVHGQGEPMEVFEAPASAPR